ncbi:MAG: transporter substrate-binding domain-containing protein [Proteobacteria bacterium]|nr:transporter substrate-binding domain-containing protein [Pseudomonadota bacterium]
MKSDGGPSRAWFAIRIALFALTGALLVSCAGMDRTRDAEMQRVLAPTGKLRVGLYPGTPTSILQGNAEVEPRGVVHDLGRELARRLGVPHELVVFSRNAEVLEAVKSGNVDVVFTNASPARAKDMDFTEPYLEIELGYLVPRRTMILRLADVDQPGVRVGVTEKSSSDSTLSKDLKKANVVRAATVKLGVGLLASGR